MGSKGKKEILEYKEMQGWLLLAQGSFAKDWENETDEEWQQYL
ncbi:MAG: hypothetical protein ACI8Y7_000831 [Candidatus Woesearchaeota archaeon]|jgi:hypothetical protein